ncbi:MAG TPA: BTAD domain-containing putative transcriptional regulator [Gemmatimonadaceae bacterium]|nr:BTAD domain-containing putative transcriptional regulator [Gemmatimonadaceae bacterium]
MTNRLTLLGPVCLTSTAAEARSMRRASQSRRIALLALIASSPDQSIARDRLVGLLWPDRDERTARHLLADSLYVLRQTLGDDALVAAGETLRLSSDIVWTDLAEFHGALAEEQWPEALRLYRGDFLDGFFVRNAVDFDQWALAERDRLRVLATRAASTLARDLQRAGRIAEATAAAERALELSPCDESVFRELVRLLVATTNRARVEAVGRSFIDRLARELGVSPSAETVRLLQETRALRNRERSIDSVTAGIIAQGRYHWHQRTRVSVERAIVYFTRAVERDANAAEAWCGLADSWVVMGGRGYAPLKVAIERGAPYATRALALDDTLSAAHTSVGGVNIMRRRWRDAEDALRRATLLDPLNADARHWLSMTRLTAFGAREEAIHEQAIAASLNPVSPMLVVVLAWQRYLRGEYDLSQASFEPAVDLNEDIEEGHTGLARVAARLGDEETVNHTITSGLAKRDDRRGDLLAEQASALAVLGDSRRARELLREATEHAAMPMNLGLAWASVGDGERALRWLAREPFQVYWTPQALWWDPRLDRIRDDARFGPIEERAARVWLPEWK